MQQGAFSEALYRPSRNQSKESMVIGIQGVRVGLRTALPVSIFSKRCRRHPSSSPQTLHKPRYRGSKKAGTSTRKAKTFGLDVPTSSDPVMCIGPRGLSSRPDDAGDGGSGWTQLTRSEHFTLWPGFKTGSILGILDRWRVATTTG